MELFATYIDISRSYESIVTQIKNIFCKFHPNPWG